MLHKSFGSAPQLPNVQSPGKKGAFPETIHDATEPAQLSYFEKLGKNFPRRTTSSMNAQARQKLKGTKPQNLEAPTIHLKTTKQQQNYKEAQRTHHSIKHRKCSMVGSMQYRPDTGGADANISSAGLDAVAKGRAMGDTANTKYARVALAQKIVLKLRTKKNKLVRLFKEFDHNMNGGLELNELVELLDRFCPGEIRSRDAHSLMKLMDKNGDGQISLDEFVSFIENFSQESKVSGVGEMQRSAPSEWKAGKMFARHRRSIAIDDEQIASHLTLTRLQQQRVKQSKERHHNRNKGSKAATTGGYLEHLGSVNQSPMLDASAADATKKGKEMGAVSSLKQGVGNTTNKIHLVLRTRRYSYRIRSPYTIRYYTNKIHLVLLAGRMRGAYFQNSTWTATGGWTPWSSSCCCSISALARLARPKVDASFGRLT
jgi:hypothetical protein